jgi:hypothetical protein
MQGFLQHDCKILLARNYMGRVVVGDQINWTSNHLVFSILF